MTDFSGVKPPMGISRILSAKIWMKFSRRRKMPNTSLNEPCRPLI